MERINRKKWILPRAPAISRGSWGQPFVLQMSHVVPLFWHVETHEAVGGMMSLEIYHNVMM